MEIRNRRKNSTFINYVFFSLGIISIFLIYFLISLSKSNTSQNFIYPNWDEVFVSIGDILANPLTLSAIGWSLLRLLICVLSSFVITIIVSFLYVVYKPSISFLRPFLFFIKVAPVAAISIYLWLAVGSEGSTYVVSIMVILPLMLEASLTSIDNIDKSIIDELRITKTSTLNKFVRVYIPMVLPYLLMSILQSFGLGFKVVIMQEYLTYTRRSIGNLLHQYLDGLEISKILALIVIVVVIVGLMEIAIISYKKHIEKNI